MNGDCVCRECRREGRLCDISDRGLRSRLMRTQLCLSCAEWRLRKLRRGDPRTVVIDGEFFTIHPPQSDQRFSGFGGRRFIIRFDDGRVVETRNLWFDGAVPPHFRDRIPDNARWGNESDLPAAS